MTSRQLTDWVERWQRGQRDALDELLRHVGRRLEQLARHLLRAHPAVQRWAETADVLQGALLRLTRALEDVRPTSVSAFFALASQQIRRELIDLARHYYGPHGLGAHHRSDPRTPERADRSHDPDALAEWSAVHEQIDRLADEERAVVELLFYQGLTQVDAAEILQVTVRTVQRRWNAALLQLHHALHDPPPR